MYEQIQTALYPQLSKSEGDNSHMAALPYKVLSVGISDMGLVRQNNEDVWAEQPSIGLYVLADGMGGHQAGEIAAKETTSSLCRVLKKKITPAKIYSFEDFQDLLKRAILFVNGVVYKMGRAEPELRGMGTTLCCLFFHEEGLVFAHVGDSRIYRMRENKLEQLTKDHSLFRDLVDQGQLNASEASDFLYKNIITRAIGTEPKVDPTVKSATIKMGDVYLMCSDGLSDLLSSIEIAQILQQAPSLDSAAQTLVKRANEEGGRDNITVVITEIQGKDESEAEKK